MKVLLAEDDPEISKLHKMALEKRNHKVTVTEDGELCLKEYKNSLEKLESETNKKTPFDVVVLDIMMPNKDGVHAAKEILELNPSQRILFSSAHVKERLVESVKDFKTVIEVLEKPFELSVLTETIEDKEAYNKLEKLKIKVHELKDFDPTIPEIREMIQELTKNPKPNVWYSVGDLIIS